MFCLTRFQIADFILSHDSIYYSAMVAVQHGDLRGGRRGGAAVSDTSGGDHSHVPQPIQTWVIM